MSQQSKIRNLLHIPHEEFFQKSPNEFPPCKGGAEKQCIWPSKYSSQATALAAYDANVPCQADGRNSIFWINIKIQNAWLEFYVSVPIADQHYTSALPDLFSPVFLKFIFQIQMTYNIILVSGIQHGDQTFIYFMK